MKVKDVIFCDDIRREMNNKHSLMGLYNDRIVIKTRPNSPIKWPFNMRLAILVRMYLEENDKFDSFKFTYINNGQKLGDITGGIKHDKKQTVLNLNLVAPNLPINKGTLGFTLTIYNKKVIVLEEKQPEAITVVTEEVKLESSLYDE